MGMKISLNPSGSLSVPAFYSSDVSVEIIEAF